jgi:hypothetical protein
MRHTISIGFVLFLVSFTAFGPAFAATPTSLQEKLAENGFTLGTEAQAITDYRLDDRVYLDRRHFILPDNSSRSYLVTTWSHWTRNATACMQTNFFCGPEPVINWSPGSSIAG